MHLLKLRKLCISPSVSECMDAIYMYAFVNIIGMHVHIKWNVMVYFIMVDLQSLPVVITFYCVFKV